MVSFTRRIGFLCCLSVINFYIHCSIKIVWYQSFETYWNFLCGPFFERFCLCSEGICILFWVHSSTYVSYICARVCAKSLQSCLILCNPMDCSLPGSSVHGILQARILEMVAMPSSRGSSQPRNQKPRSPALQVDSLPSEPPEKPVEAYNITRGSALTRFARGSVPTSTRFSWGSGVKSQLKKARG